MPPFLKWLDTHLNAIIVATTLSEESATIPRRLLASGAATAKEGRRKGLKFMLSCVSNTSDHIVSSVKKREEERTNTAWGGGIFVVFPLIHRKCYKNLTFLLYQLQKCLLQTGQLPQHFLLLKSI